jgi:TRAP-type C4-dicarboxylate transport system permease small subunit
MSNLAEAQRTAAGGGDSRNDDQPGLVAALRTVDRMLARIEEAVLSICLFALITVGVYLALKRRFFPSPIYWADEIVRYSVFFLGLCGAALAAQADRLFNIDMFTRLLKPRAKLVMRVVTSGFTVYVCWLLFNASVFLRNRVLVSENEGEIIKSSTGGLALPIAMGLIAAHLLLHIAIDVYYLATGTLPAEVTAPREPKA